MRRVLALAALNSMAASLAGCGHCTDLRPYNPFRTCQDDQGR
jgi:hypothetical protein